jgi:hypothetical protein
VRFRSTPLVMARMPWTSKPPGLRDVVGQFYFGGAGGESSDMTVPQRGQWIQVTSSGDLKVLQVRGAVEAPGVEGCRVEDVFSSSGSAAMPFLNSFMDLPSDFARSGSLLPPKSTRTITRITSSSW